MESGFNLRLYSNVFASPQEIFEKLQKEIQYLPPPGSQIPQANRDTATFGDLGVLYSFYGLSLTPEPWTPLLLEMKATVEAVCGLQFNFLAINRYEDEGVIMSRHREVYDNLDGPIASVTFGEPRILLFTKSAYTKERLELKPNTLLVMKDTRWSLAAPPLDNSGGVHLNLTFYNLLKTPTNSPNKRKPVNQRAVPPKRFIACLSPESPTFEVLPDNMFALGDDVFVKVQHSRRYPIIHIRRFKKLGATYYPTEEGVTLHHTWIEEVMGRKNVPQTERELNSILLMRQSHLQITSENFSEFTFTCSKRALNGSIYASTSILLSASQWSEMLQQYANICTKVLDYQYSSTRFRNLYSFTLQNGMPISLPSSLDTSLGIQHASIVLKNSLFDLLKEKGVKEPETVAEEVWAIHPESFNSAALDLDMVDLVASFRDRLCENERSLQMRPAMYVTEEFFKKVKLHVILRELRAEFCPPDTFEYFENFN